MADLSAIPDIELAVEAERRRLARLAEEDARLDQIVDRTGIAATKAAAAEAASKGALVSANAAVTAAGAAEAAANRGEAMGEVNKAGIELNAATLDVIDTKLDLVLSLLDAEPTDPPVEPPIEPPPPATRAPWSLTANPNQAISQAWEPYFGRVVAAARNPNLYPNALKLARTGDLYDIGRFGREHITTLTLALRATGHPVFVELIGEWLDACRDGLRDIGGGWLGFVWLHDPKNTKYYNLPWHEMDTMLSVGTIALAAHAVALNGDHDRADFWRDWLSSDFPESWEAARGGLPYHALAHPWLALTQYHWYAGTTEVVGDRLNAFRESINPDGSWPFGVIPEGWTDRSPMPDTYYPSLTATVLMDLHFENLVVPTHAELARLWNSNLFPGEAIATDGQWSITSYGLAAAWDEDGDLGRKVSDVIVSVGDDRATPRRVQGAAAQLLAAAVRGA